MELKTFKKITTYFAIWMFLLITTMSLIGCESKSDANSETSESVSGNNTSSNVQHESLTDNSKQQVKPVNDQTVNSGEVAQNLLEDFSGAGFESNTTELEDAFKSLNNIYAAAKENRVAMLSAKLANKADNTIKTDKEVKKNGNR